MIFTYLSLSSITEHSFHGATPPCIRNNLLRIYRYAHTRLRLLYAKIVKEKRPENNVNPNFVVP